MAKNEYSANTSVPFAAPTMIESENRRNDLGKLCFVSMFFF